MFAKIENEKVVEWPIQNITKLFPNTSFPSPLTQESLPEGYVVVSDTPPPYFNQMSQKILPGMPEKQNGKWVQSWNILEKTEQEINEMKEEVSLNVRAKRNYLLKSTDWTQLSDSPTNKTEWAIYRQALRDVTEQEGFPYNIIWPVEPK